MELIITGSDDNLNDFIESNKQNVYGLTLDKKEDGSIRMEYNSKDEYENALYICACYLGFKSFIVEVKKFIEENDMEQDGFILMVNEMRKQSFISYMALNTLKALRDYQDGSNSLNLDAFLKFGLKSMDKEVIAMASVVDAHLNYIKTQDAIEELTLPEIKELLMTQLEDGVDIEDILPILRKITNLDSTLRRKEIYIKKEGKSYKILDNKGMELSVATILSTVCDNLELIISETDPLDLFLKDIVFIQKAMWVEKIVYYEETFSEQEHSIIQKFFKYIKQTNPDVIIEKNKDNV